MRTKTRVYNDGVAILCEERTKKTDFSAKINPKERKYLKEIARISYGNVSIREDDLSFAEREERTISMKIRITYCPYVNKKKYMVIGGTLYFIYSMDISEDKTEMYVSLEETRCLKR